MKICEDCIKKDVCKFRESVEKYEPNEMELPEPLKSGVECKYKRVDSPYNWDEPTPYTAYPGSSTISYPSNWTNP